MSIEMNPSTTNDKQVLFSCVKCNKACDKLESEGTSICYECYKNCQHDKYITREFYENKPNGKQYVKRGEDNVVTRCEDCMKDISNLKCVRI